MDSLSCLYPSRCESARKQHPRQTCTAAGLKVQEQSMHDLARMAEARQSEARQEVADLLTQRSKLLEAANDAARCGQT